MSVLTEYPDLSTIPTDSNPFVPKREELLPKCSGGIRTLHSLQLSLFIFLDMVEHLRWFQCGLFQGLLEMQLAILKIKVHSSMIRSCYLPRLIFSNRNRGVGQSPIWDLPSSRKVICFPTQETERPLFQPNSRANWRATH